jgi:hypothetical protein
MVGHPPGPGRATDLSYEVVGGEEISGKFVISGGDASPILAAAKEVLDLVPAPIDAFGAIGLFGGIIAAWDDRQSSVVADVLSHCPAVVSFVGSHSQRCPWCIEQSLDGLTVMHLAAGDNEVQWPAFAVDAGMDLGAAPTPADADGLLLLPPFAPLAARCAFTMVLSIRCRLSRDFKANWSNIRFQMPRRDQRLYRL